jgi:hypothetical protein
MEGKPMHSKILNISLWAAVPAALVALVVTVLGLSAVNLSDALQSVLAGRPTTMYWAQTGLIAGYLAWLVVFHLRAKADV